MLQKQQKTSTRRAPRKVPSWHLTSNDTMEYIMENDAKKEKERKKEKYTKAKKEAVAKVKKDERKAKTKSLKSDPLVQASPQCR